ncbi:hypothetical protein TNCV_2617161 [Trichonephila clavipes]|nr:hypothetical protein TNCV_2617161 [Trichonephila clavipes]
MPLQERKGTVDGYEWRCRNRSKDNRHDVVRVSYRLRLERLPGVKSAVKQSRAFSFSYFPKIKDQNILKELRGKKIYSTDSSCEGAEIDLLIGGNVMGRLLTGNVVTLHSGLGYPTTFGTVILQNRING